MQKTPTSIRRLIQRCDGSFLSTCYIGFVMATPMWMTKRDEAIISAVHHYRMMSLAQIEELFFRSPDGQVRPDTRARKRLPKLCKGHYLVPIARPFLPAAYRLGKSGARFLDVSQSFKRSPAFVEHKLDLASFRMACELSAQANGVTIHEWTDDTDFNRLPAKDRDKVVIRPTNSREEKFTIFPDSYFGLETPQGRGHFFLEIDRSTESIRRRWRRKFLGYKEYVMSGGFHRRYGVDPEQTAIRVLTTTPSLERAENLQKAAEHYGDPQASQIFLFTPLANATAEKVLTSPIWLRANFQGRQSLL